MEDRIFTVTVGGVGSTSHLRRLDTRPGRLGRLIWAAIGLLLMVGIMDVDAVEPNGFFYGFSGDNSQTVTQCSTLDFSIGPNPARPRAPQGPYTLFLYPRWGFPQILPVNLTDSDSFQYVVELPLGTQFAFGMTDASSPALSGGISDLYTVVPGFNQTTFSNTTAERDCATRISQSGAVAPNPNTPLGSLGMSLNPGIHMTECQNVQVTWLGAAAPVVVTVLRLYNTPINFTAQSGATELYFQNSLQAGYPFMVALSDAVGRYARITDVLRSTPGDTSCFAYSSSGHSIAVAAGTGVGVAVALIALTALLWWYVHRRRERKRRDGTESGWAVAGGGGKKRWKKGSRWLGSEGGASLAQGEKQQDQNGVQNDQGGAGTGSVVPTLGQQNGARVGANDTSGTNSSRSYATSLPSPGSPTSGQHSTGGLVVPIPQRRGPDMNDRAYWAPTPPPHHFPSQTPPPPRFRPPFAISNLNEDGEEDNSPISGTSRSPYVSALAEPASAHPSAPAYPDEYGRPTPGEEYDEEHLGEAYGYGHAAAQQHSRSMDLPRRIPPRLAISTSTEPSRQRGPSNGQGGLHPSQRRDRHAPNGDDLGWIATPPVGHSPVEPSSGSSFARGHHASGAEADPGRRREGSGESESGIAALVAKLGLPVGVNGTRAPPPVDEERPAERGGDSTPRSTTTPVQSPRMRQVQAGDLSQPGSPATPNSASRARGDDWPSQHRSSLDGGREDQMGQQQQQRRPMTAPSSGQDPGSRGDDRSHQGLVQRSYGQPQQRARTADGRMSAEFGAYQGDGRRDDRDDRVVRVHEDGGRSLARGPDYPFGVFQRRQQRVEELPPVYESAMAGRGQRPGN